MNIDETSEFNEAHVEKLNELLSGRQLTYEKNKLSINKYKGKQSFSNETLEFFKSAIVSQGKLFVRGKKRKATAVKLGQQQLMMLANLVEIDPNMIPDKLLIIDTGEKSRLQFK